MAEKEYITYKGQEFQIEWYYAPEGKSQALTYFLILSPEQHEEE